MMQNLIKCKPQRCKLKALCLRYTTPPTDLQYYFSKEPSDPTGTKCEMIKPNN